MDFIKAASIIGRDLEEALALLDQLSSLKSTHTAEIELARLRVRSASELLRLLPGLDRVVSPEVESELAVETAVVISAFQEPQKIQEPHKVHDPAVLPAESQESRPIQEPQTVHNPAVPSKEVPSQESRQIQEPAVQSAEVRPQELQKTREPHKTPEPQRSILADRFASAGTFGEKMQSAKQDEMISSVMHSKPIADIATAIGMNDRFYFIRELFSGDIIAYQDTIKRLNAAASLGEAMRILDESTVMGSDPAAQSSFVDVVRRKFSLNG